MPFFQLIIVLAVVGVAIGLIEAYLPLTPPIRTAIRVLVVLAVVWVLLFAVGMAPAPKSLW